MQMQRVETKAGHGDLGGTVTNGLGHRFALGKMPVNILDGDGGIIDENAHGERQTAKGHDVDRLADGA